MPAAAATDETRQGLLDALRSDEAWVRAAEVRKIRTALEWAIAHEVLSLDEASFHAGFGEHGLTLAGPGAPLVGEAAVTEMAVALGLSTDGGRRFLGVILEVRYRLPASVGGGVVGAVCVVAGQDRRRGHHDPL